MAQAVRHDKVEIDESLLSQAKEKALVLQKVASNGEKAPGAYVPAGQLTYAEPEGWKINPSCAVLIGCHELRVDGEYMAQELAKLFYEVSFEVLLLPKCNIKDVELTLTLPDGSVQSINYCLSSYPRNKPISLKVGDFFNRFVCGNIKYELKGTECMTCKTDLVIFGVDIKPPGK